MEKKGKTLILDKRVHEVIEDVKYLDSVFIPFVGYDRNEIEFADYKSVKDENWVMSDETFIMEAEVAWAGVGYRDGSGYGGWIEYKPLNELPKWVNEEIRERLPINSNKAYSSSYEAQRAIDRALEQKDIDNIDYVMFGMVREWSIVYTMISNLDPEEQ